MQKEIIKQIEQTINRKKLIPSAFQVLWYSDWEYLSLDIEIVLEIGVRKRVIFDFLKSPKKEYQSLALKKLSPYSDEFEDSDDAIQLAKEIGSYLSNKYQVPLYFPSPDKWNDDCPNWWEQDKGINCEDCSKLVIPSESKHLTKNLCYNCHINRKSNERYEKSMRSNSMADSEKGLTVFRVKTTKKEQILYSMEASNSIWKNFIEEILNIKISSQPLYSISLDKKKLVLLKVFLEKKIDEQLPKLKSIEDIDFYKPREVEYKNEILLVPTWGHMREYESKFRLLDEINDSIQANNGYKLCFHNTLRFRENKILSRIGKGDSKLTKESLIPYYNDVLSANEIISSLERLITLECIRYNGKILEITEKGNDLLLVVPEKFRKKKSADKADK